MISTCIDASCMWALCYSLEGGSEAAQMTSPMFLGTKERKTIIKIDLSVYRALCQTRCVRNCLFQRDFGNRAYNRLQCNTAALVIVFKSKVQ